MQVETSIDEAEVGRIRVGQEATFTVDSFPGPHLSRHGLADAQGGAGRAERRDLHRGHRDVESRPEALSRHDRERAHHRRHARERAQGAERGAALPSRGRRRTRARPAARAEPAGAPAPADDGKDARERARGAAGEAMRERLVEGARAQRRAADAARGDHERHARQDARRSTPRTRASAASRPSGCAPSRARASPRC